MPARWSEKRGRARLRGLAAASLALPLWLSACVVDGPREPATESSVPAATPEAAAPAVSSPTPAPQAKDAVPLGTAGTTAPAREESAAPGLSAGPGTASASARGKSARGGEGPPEAAASEAAGATAAGTAAGTVTAYYVLPDDGGRNGVRFGCNDSLVGITMESPIAGDSLPAAMEALLQAPGEAETPPPGVYNALSGSRLTFLSGSFDGTTVTVYLAGTLRPAGTCDVPRLEAQLTQTALASVGAIRAEIRVNGRSLAEALSLK